MVKVSKARAAALREEIFDSTAVELRRVGYEATALTSVASRCGLATSAIYNRFPGKEELVSALIRERLDPGLGRALDTDLASLWHDPSLIGLVDGDQLCLLYELQLAARRSPQIRSAVLTFVQRRIESALAARAEAERHDRVRPNQDPHAQVLLQAAGDTGSYLLNLAGDAPNGGMASVDQVVRMALTKVPMHTPATPGRAARRRRDPGKSTPQPQPLDDLGAALVLSAAEVFAEDGYDVATVAEIARQAGVTTGAIYNRFSGKGGLLAEVVSQVSAPRAMADLATVADALTSGSAAAAGKAIGALVERAREPEHVRDNALRLEARHAARLEPEVDEVVRPLQDHALATLSAEIRRAQSAGALRPDVDAEALAWWFAGLPLGIALLEDELPPSIDWSPTFAAVIRALRTNPT